MQKAKKHKEPKTLTILFGEKSKPAYKFTGLWTGNDITVVRTHLPREYRIWQRDLRKELVRSESNEQGN